jgi:dolichyl-phosphate-mannose-protein mannosyltransferase
MATTATPQGALRQRNIAAPSTKKTKDGASSDVELDKLVKAAAAKSAASSERDFKAVFAVITVLAFVTRFWGISHPNEVVFDEVHFGKVRDPRPSLLRLPPGQPG